MARFAITKKMESDTKPEAVFEAAQAAFNQLGWEIYKMRSIAFLVEARITGDEGYVLANVIATVFGDPEIKCTIKGDTASQEAVEKYAGQIMDAIDKSLLATK